MANELALSRSDESSDEIRYVTTPDGREVALISYDISFEPIEDQPFPVPPEIEGELESLHDQALDTPETAIGRLEEMVERYPQVPMLMNWLTIAYSGVGRIADADALNERLCAAHPTYLFGRIHRAQRFLDQGRPDRVREAFGGQPELKLMYPDRTVFHYTEVVALYGVLADWRLAENDVDTAKIYLEILTKLVPDHPITKRLTLLILPHLLRRGLERLGGFGRGRAKFADPDGLPARPLLPGASDARRSSTHSDFFDRPFRQGSHTPKKDRNRKGRRR